MSSLLCKEDHDIVMVTGNFTRKNTIGEFLPFYTFNWYHRYTIVLKRVFLIFAVFSARQHTAFMLSALHAIARPSVRHTYFLSAPLGSRDVIGHVII